MRNNTKFLTVFCLLCITISNEALAIFEHRTGEPNLDPRSRATGDVNLGIVNPLAALENPAYLAQIQKFAAQLVCTGEGGIPSTSNSSMIMGFRTDYAIFGVSACYNFVSYKTNTCELITGKDHIYNLDIGLHCATEINKNIDFGVSAQFGYEEMNSIGTGLTFNTGIVFNNLIEKTTFISDNHGLKGFSIAISFQNIGQRVGYRRSSSQDDYYSFRSANTLNDHYTPWSVKINASWNVIYTDDYHLIAGYMYRPLLVDYTRRALFAGDEYSEGFGIEGKYKLLYIRIGKVNEYRHIWNKGGRYYYSNRDAELTYGFGLDFGQVFFDISTRNEQYGGNTKWVSIGLRL